MINDHPSFPDLCKGLTDIVNVKWNILDYQSSMIKHTILPMISRKQIKHVINQSKRMKLDLGLFWALSQLWLPITTRSG